MIALLLDLSEVTCFLPAASGQWQAGCKAATSLKGDTGYQNHDLFRPSGMES